MLTYTPNPKPKRKDLPWLLFITALIWIAGSCFFHDPWEPYEPYVVAVVKSILATNSWLVPYISPNVPYLDLQPFYFWIFALIIKIFHFNNVVNAIRLINSIIIFCIIALMGRVGSRLSAFRNGRTVVMILISTVGFVNNAYQLSPHLIVILGFVLYVLALQKLHDTPGSAAAILFIALTCISLHFTGQYIFIALAVLFILPLCDKHWRTSEYLTTTVSGVLLFLFVFILYAWQLYRVDAAFFMLWKLKYINFFMINDVWLSIKSYSVMLVWYLIPGWFLIAWTIYRRGRKILKDPILSCNLLLIVLFILIAIFSGHSDESDIFPIIVPVVLLASIEVDSIRITIVSLFNWFSIIVFGFAGTTIALLYFALSLGVPQQLFLRAKFFAPTYHFQFNFWQVLLASIIAIIWLFMVTRKHIRGREMITNWASGSTFVLVMFISLCIPWFNSVLSFSNLVNASKPYLKYDANNCIATTNGIQIQDALWYYYADVRLIPEENFANSNCKQAIITMVNGNKPDVVGWRTVWSGKRAVDFRSYYLLEKIQ